jgi:hypothetical protein
MEDRYRSLVTGWLSSRLRGYLPPGEVDEAYRKPLFDADDQNLDSEVELHTWGSEAVSFRSTTRLTVTSLR